MRSEVITAPGVPAFVTGRRTLGWWGVVMLVMIESTVFAALIASYYYLYSGAPVWPPDGISAPSLPLPTINAIILWASMFMAFLGNRAASRGDNRRLAIWYGIGSVMLAGFLTLKVIEYSGYSYYWDTNAYGSIVWTITGFHTAHVIIVLLKTVPMIVLATQGFWTERRRSAIQGAALYWYFVAIAWIPLFATLYLFPNSTFR
jgi:cytochrome c oxidase subunit I+III